MNDRLSSIRDQHSVLGPGPLTRAWARRFAAFWLVVVAGVASAGLALGYAGRWKQLPDLAAEFTPQWMMLSALALIGLLLLRFWRLSALPGAALIVAAASIAPLYFHDPAAPNPSGSTITIGELNLSVGNRRFNEVIKYLRRKPADVVILVESSPDWDAALRTGQTGYQMIVPAAGGLNSGMTVLSRVPVRASVLEDLNPPPTIPPVALTLDFDGGPVRMLAVHTQSPRGRGELYVRNTELKTIASWVQSGRGETVVVGDFNTTPWSATFRDLISTTGLVDSSLGFGLQPSWRLAGGVIALPIDHLIHSRGLTTVARSLGPSFGSDHSMILVTLARARSKA